MDRLASPREKEHWDEHRAVAVWIQDFVDFVEVQLPKQVEQEKTKNTETVTDESGSTPYMEMSPDVNDQA